MGLGQMAVRLAMVDPAAPGTFQLVPLSLNAGSKDNKFKKAKESGTALEPYSRTLHADADKRSILFQNQSPLRL